VRHDRGVDGRDARVVQQVDGDLMPGRAARRARLRRFRERARQPLEGRGVEFETALGVLNKNTRIVDRLEPRASRWRRA